MNMPKPPKRFAQPWHTTFHFYYNKGVGVHCPKCNGHAIAHGTYATKNLWTRPEKVTLTCQYCSYSRTNDEKKWYGVFHASEKSTCGYCGTGIYIDLKTTKNIKLFYTTTSCSWTSCSCYSCKIPNGTVTADCSRPSCDYKTKVNVTWSPLTYGPEAIDPFFGLPLWHTAPFKNHTLWGYNTQHIMYLIDYISSDLRERNGEASKNTIPSNLPTWMKLAKNKKGVLKALEKIIVDKKPDKL